MRAHLDSLLKPLEVRINYTGKNFEDIVGLEVNGVLFPVVE
jgi:hypothetical protein